ncbi:MAG: hypothetical protein ACJAZO_002600 [Myxococcota bacterium]
MRILTITHGLPTLLAYDPTSNMDTGTDSDSADAGTWYTACGDPVCQSYTGPLTDVATCFDEVVGDACAELDASCDSESERNALVVCTTEDPTAQPNGCPISRAAHKTDITYLSAEEHGKAVDWLKQTRLATWHYQDQDATERLHLGLLIDDPPTSPAVRPGGEHIDLYGYTSLAVAALHVQQ